MSPKKPARKRRAHWVLRIVVLGIIIYGVWQLFGLHVNEPSLPATPSEAQAYTGVPLPPEAKNISVAGYHQWIDFGNYVRFEAPLDVCLKYAAKVAPGVSLQPVDDDELQRDGKPLRNDVFKDLTWFDLANARNVVGGAGTASESKEVWVDQIRGVFYFCETD